MKYFLLLFLASFLLSGCVKDTEKKLPEEKNRDNPETYKFLEGFYVGNYTIEEWKGESEEMLKSLESTFSEFKGIKFGLEANIKYENKNFFKVNMFQEKLKDKTGLKEVPEALLKLTDKNFEMLYIKGQENYKYKGEIINEGGRTILRGQWTSTGYKGTLGSYSGNFELTKQQ